MVHTMKNQMRQRSFALSGLSFACITVFALLLAPTTVQADPGAKVYSSHYYSGNSATQSYRDTNKYNKSYRNTNYYRVQRGDTVNLIAKRLRIKTSSLISRNNLRSPYWLKTGQYLCINIKHGCKTKSYRSANKQSYRVQRGDTLRGIAIKQGISYKKIASWNHLSPPYTLSVGQRLYFYSRGKSNNSYLVKSGDTLQKIALNRSFSFEQLADWNSLTYPYTLHVGQRLYFYSHWKNRYYVKSGDTLQKIGIRKGIPYKKIASWNDLSSPYTLYIGQRLYLYETGITNKKAVKAGTVTMPNRTHTVGRYETLDYLSNRFSVSEKQMIRLNKLQRPYKLKKGQKLCLDNPAPCKSTMHIVVENETLDQISQRYDIDVADLIHLNSLRTPYEVHQDQRICLLKQYPCLGASRENKRPASWMPRLDWPLNNDHAIITSFGRSGSRMHDGIDIRAIIGTPVYAAADGRVVFAGENIDAAKTSSTYGKVVIIQHPNNIFTVYAQNSHIFSKVARIERKVKQGDRIALSGNTGRANSAHLHFELRQGKKAIDPIDYLPKRKMDIQYEE